MKELNFGFSNRRLEKIVQLAKSFAPISLEPVIVDGKFTLITAEDKVEYENWKDPFSKIERAEHPSGLPSYTIIRSQGNSYRAPAAEPPPKVEVMETQEIEKAVPQPRRKKGLMQREISLRIAGLVIGAAAGLGVFGVKYEMDASHPDTYEYVPEYYKLNEYDEARIKDIENILNRYDPFTFVSEVDKLRLRREIDYIKAQVPIVGTVKQMTAEAKTEFLITLLMLLAAGSISGFSIASYRARRREGKEIEPAKAETAAISNVRVAASASEETNTEAQTEAQKAEIEAQAIEEAAQAEADAVENQQGKARN